MHLQSLFKYIIYNRFHPAQDTRKREKKQPLTPRSRVWTNISTSAQY